MNVPPFDQYAAAFQMVVGVMDRCLRAVAYEEERRSRDDVLVALSALRDAMAEQGVNVPAQVVLGVFESQTGYDGGRASGQGASLATLVKQATDRRMTRERTSAFDIIESTMKHIENERKNDNGKSA